MNTPPPHDTNNCTSQTIRVVVVVVVFNSDGGGALLFCEGVIEIEMFNNNAVHSSAQLTSNTYFFFDWIGWFILINKYREIGALRRVTCLWLTQHHRNLHNSSSFILIFSNFIFLRRAPLRWLWKHGLTQMKAHRDHPVSWKHITALWEEYFLRQRQSIIEVYLWYMYSKSWSIPVVSPVKQTYVSFYPIRGERELNSSYYFASWTITDSFQYMWIYFLYALKRDLVRRCKDSSSHYVSTVERKEQTMPPNKANCIKVIPIVAAVTKKIPFEIENVMFNPFSSASFSENRVFS